MNEIDELKKMLENHEKRISSLEKICSSSDNLPLINEEKIILKLIDTGFFDDYQKYGDLIQELKIQAKFDKDVKYGKILQKLTKEDKLKRKISHKQWVYAKNV